MQDELEKQIKTHEDDNLEKHFDQWVDEFFANSNVDLKILKQAYLAARAQLISDKLVT